jgi:sulfatase maturation enzyme AslB (radical SAM superfamily)
MLPGSNQLKDSSNYRQGTCKNLLENEAVLRALNDNSRAVNMKLKEKCENCKIFTTCPHCAADCVNDNDATLTKTTSVCNYTRLQVYFARIYWERIKRLYPSLYSNYSITWTEKDNKELMELVLKDIIKLKKGEKK